MNKEPSQLELVYDHETGQIKLEAYCEGFFIWENDVTEQVMQIAVEKLFVIEDYSLLGWVSTFKT